MKKPKKKKRYEKRKYKTSSKSLKIFAANAAGINSKINSFEDILSRLKPQIWILEETKLKPNGKIKCDILRDFQVFYLNRQKSQGGGVALGVHKEIESTLIRDGDDETEVISVQTILGGLPVRLIVGYGPQENATLEKKIKLPHSVQLGNFSSA